MRSATVLRVSGFLASTYVSVHHTLVIAFQLGFAPGIPKKESDAIVGYLRGGTVPKLIVEGVGEFDVDAGKRLILALTDDAKVDQLHACGGNARCTTCRVEFVAGEPSQITDAEKSVLAAKGVTGVRLSCQLNCDSDMTVRIISRLAGSGRADAGKRPTDAIAPPAVWGVKA